MLLNHSGIRRNARVAFVTAASLILSLWVFTWAARTRDAGYQQHVLSYPAQAQAHHPIDDLIRSAQTSHKRALAERTHNVADGAAAYRRRRGRDPPPGFDRWYARALREDAVLVESFFDQIYEDLGPFYGLKPSQIQETMEGWGWMLRVRGGKLVEPKGNRFRKKIWAQMVRRFASELPDMDLPLNVLDEARVVLPREEVDGLMAGAGLDGPRAREVEGDSGKAHWITSGPIWDLVRETCPSTAEARSSDDSEAYPANLTTLRDPCIHRELAEMHGALIEPSTLSVTQDLVPIFSDSKIPGYNDILLPPASYYSSDPLFGLANSWWPWSAGFSSVPWQSKKSGVVWRGKATGGTVRPGTWKKLHRQRLVSMLNASDIAGQLADRGNLDFAGQAFLDAPPESVSAWLKDTADVGFTDLLCSSTCEAMSSAYKLVPSINMKDQYSWKYLLDIDGNGHSGRFRAFLLSNSAVMKATIFKEWHDSRLVPWAHYIPISMDLNGLWATMAYFVGFGETGAHDAAGRRIAVEGKEWAEKVLRKSDMELYAYRLLLEYARLCDERRESLGYTADL